MVAPLRSGVHLDYGDLLMAANRPREALVEYQALLAMSVPDFGKLANLYNLPIRGSYGDTADLGGSVKQRLHLAR